jgi:hypothetical protein
MNAVFFYSFMILFCYVSLDTKNWKTLHLQTFSLFLLPQEELDSLQGSLAHFDRENLSR